MLGLTLSVFSTRVKCFVVAVFPMALPWSNLERICDLDFRLADSLIMAADQALHIQQTISN